MSARVVIRAATAADIPAVAAIYRYHVLHGLASFETEAPDAVEMTRRHAAVLDLGLPFLVAELDAKIAGFAYAALYRARPAYRYTVEDSVYVRHDCAGRRVGSELLSRLIAGCEQAGRRQMIAVIGDSENWGSIRLHEKFGFERVGMLPAVGFKFGRWVDSVLMQRGLGAGGSPDALPDAESGAMES